MIIYFIKSGQCNSQYLKRLKARLSRRQKHFELEKTVEKAGFTDCPRGCSFNLKPNVKCFDRRIIFIVKFGVQGNNKFNI